MKLEDKKMKLKILTVPVLIALTITTASIQAGSNAGQRIGLQPVDLNVGDLQMVAEFVSAAVFRLPAQQNEADRKVLAEIRAGADKGDAKAQYELGRAFFSGTLGVTKDEAEAVKWHAMWRCG
jgi:hypothetical protein